MTAADLNRFAALGANEKKLLLAACHRLGLSARGFDRVRPVARTLADLDGEETLSTRHVAEALQYRQSAGQRRD